MKKQSKRAWVLALPHSMSAKDVVKKAAEENIKLSEGYVYNIRASANAKKPSKKARVVSAPIAKAIPYRPSSMPARVDFARPKSRAQALFFEALDEIITDRVKQIFSQVVAESK